MVSTASKPLANRQYLTLWRTASNASRGRWNWATIISAEHGQRREPEDAAAQALAKADARQAPVRTRLKRNKSAGPRATNPIAQIPPATSQCRCSDKNAQAIMPTPCARLRSARSPAFFLMTRMNRSSSVVVGWVMVALATPRRARKLPHLFDLLGLNPAGFDLGNVLAPATGRAPAPASALLRRKRMVMRSQTSCTSASRWLHSRTVLPCCFEGQDQVLHFPRADGVQAGGRFIQEDQVGIVDQGLGQADAAGHSLGILAQLALAGLGVEADDVQQFGNAPVEFAPGQAETAARKTAASLRR